MGIEYAPYIEYYRENSGELTELNRREQELLREYDKLAAGDFTVELEGGQWSYSRLEREPDLDDGQYAEIEDALVREKNRVLGSKFRELVQVCADSRALATTMPIPLRLEPGPSGL